MRFFEKKIVADTVIVNHGTFSIDGVVSFTVHNRGSGDVMIGYSNEAPNIPITSGESMVFPAESFHVFSGKMKVVATSGNPNVLVIKSVTKTTEF